MSIETMWLQPYREKAGRDQLGIRATSVRMYDHLVPGITNVTDRARYFSLYAYAIGLWARKEHTSDSGKFYRFLRRIECILALADKIITRESGEESPRVVGTIRINRWMKEQSSLADSRSVPLKKLEDEYFGNRFGAFGQYYAGPIELLRIVDRKEKIPRLIKPTGVELAESVALSAGRCGFDEIVFGTNPTIQQLRRVGEDLAFNRANSEERRLLREILFDMNQMLERPGERRRETLLLLLSLAQQSPHGLSDPIWQLFDAALSKRAGAGVEFRCPQPLSETFSKWRSYALHEFLASAFEVFLSAVVLEVSEPVVKDGNSMQAIARRLARSLPNNERNRTISALMKDVASTMQDRQLDPEGDENEERKLRETAVNSLGEKRGVAILDAIKLLCRIQTRLQGIGADKSPYWSFTTDGTSIEQNRFGLSHLVRWFDDNTSVTIQIAAEDLARLVLNTHLRVATAKVAFNRDFTFKVYPDNGELRWVRDVEPAFSQPRLFQARQMLADVGLLASGEAGLKLTADGSEMLKQFDCAL